MVRVASGQLRKKHYRSRTTCAHGHRWTPATTRWRRRTRADGSVLVERDCLMCRRDQKRQARARAAGRVPSPDQLAL